MPKYEYQNQSTIGLAAAAIAVGLYSTPDCSLINTPTRNLGLQTIQVPLVSARVRGNYRALNDGIYQATTGKARTARLFSELSQKWKDDIGAESSLSKITGNLNYLKIIAMGNDAIPFILADLKNDSAPWFVALIAITGKNIGKEFPGKFRLQANAWISWGKENGYI